MTDVPDRRLDEFDKTEWRDVARLLRPDWTDEDLDREWADFLEFKRLRGEVGGNA